jgi:Domain of unknown function (DUF4111)
VTPRASLDDLPPAAVAASVGLRDELLRILGDDLVGMWVHGGTTFADRPVRPGDVDVGAVVSNVAPDERLPRRWRADPASRPSRIAVAEQALARQHGRSIDALYLRLEDVGRGAVPTRAFEASRRETSWPVYRAHWLAGQYVSLCGAPPEELVTPPTTAELRRALERELEHLERHVDEGAAGDPFEATYAILNGCRILHTLETGSPVLSKHSAGSWGLEHLPERWHDAIRAAARSYDGVASSRDNELLRESMPPFVAAVRERLPLPASRRSRRPRWS